MRLLITLALTILSTSAAIAAEVAENVLVVTFDGLRWQEFFGGADPRMMSKDANATPNLEAMRAKYWAGTDEERRMLLLPFFWSTIMSDGQIYGHSASGSVATSTNGLYFSYPGYNELFTGKTDPEINSNAKVNNPNVNVLEWLNGQPGFEGKVAAFASWDVFPYILNAERSGVPVNAGWMHLAESPDPERLAMLNRMSDDTPHYWDAIRFDLFTHYGAEEYIKKHRPRVIYLGYGETDDWAHDRRYDMYLESARRTDDYIKRLWELLQSMDQYKGKTALIVSTDHGRGDSIVSWTSHGDELPESDRIWMAAMGPGVTPKGLAKDTPTTQSQFAATVAALLGLDFTADHPEAAEPIPFGAPE